MSLPVHASVAGKVVKVDRFPHPTGITSPAVVIENDGTDTLSESIQPVPKYLESSAVEIRAAVREAGIAGMGGAAFPTHVKITPPADKTIDTLIINGVECEPYLTADHRLMVEFADEIMKGYSILHKLLRVKRTILAIEANKPDAIKIMRQKVTRRKVIDVAVLKVKYPQGAEKQLIRSVTGRVVPLGGLPHDVGCLVVNVATVRAIYQAVAERLPCFQRVVTVTGSGVRQPRNVLVRLGTPFKNVIDFCGGAAGKITKIIMGGPIMGIAQFTDEVPVIKATSGILVLVETGKNHQIELPCISCGRCVEVCPMRLIPTDLAQAIDFSRPELAEKIGLTACIECGACAYICPAHRRLVQSIRFGKRLLLRSRQELN